MNEMNSEWKIGDPDLIREWRELAGDDEATVMVHRQEGRLRCGFHVRPKQFTLVYGDTLKDCVREAALIRRDLYARNSTDAVTEEGGDA